MAQCKNCNGPTEGFKCDVCPLDSPVHLSDHECGGEHLVPRCSRSGQAETRCVIGKRPPS